MRKLGDMRLFIPQNIEILNFICKLMISVEIYNYLCRFQFQWYSKLRAKFLLTNVTLRFIRNSCFHWKSRITWCRFQLQWSSKLRAKFLITYVTLRFMNFTTKIAEVIRDRTRQSWVYGKTESTAKLSAPQRQRSVILCNTWQSWERQHDVFWLARNESLTEMTHS